MAATCITLLTDFGTRDGYVGAMKGVIASIAPRVPIVDIAHDIAPGDVTDAAYVLRTAVATFPPGCVHVAVVDPGVGTERLGLLVEDQAGSLFVGPDNGILSLAAGRPSRVLRLDRPRWFLPTPSRTFHGRDVFAPVAAHAAASVEIAELGTTVESMVELPLPEPKREAGVVRGEVVHVDRFGNLITNITADDVRGLGASADLTVDVAGHATVSLFETYGRAANGTLVAVLGSEGCLELAVAGGSAQELIGRQAVRGMQVRLERAN